MSVWTVDCHRCCKQLSAHRTAQCLVELAQTWSVCGKVGRVRDVGLQKLQDIVCHRIFLCFDMFKSVSPEYKMSGGRCESEGRAARGSRRANDAQHGHMIISHWPSYARGTETTLSRLEVRVLLCELPIHCAQVMSYLEHLASPRSKAKASCMSISYLVSPELMPSKASSPAVVPCPICNRTVPMGIINNHIDNGCPPPKASDLEAALPPSSKNKGKQKQEWTKLFQGGGDGAVISGPKKGKGKSRYECRSFRSVAGLC